MFFVKISQLKKSLKLFSSNGCRGLIVEAFRAGDGARLKKNSLRGRQAEDGEAGPEIDVRAIGNSDFLSCSQLLL